MGIWSARREHERHAGHPRHPRRRLQGVLTARRRRGDFRHGLLVCAAVLSSMTRRVTLAFAVGLSLATPVAAQSGPPLPVLTHIRAIRTLSQDDGARGYPVRIRATVTHFDEAQATGLLVHDGQFGQFVLPPTRPETTAVWQTLRSGDD